MVTTLDKLNMLYDKVIDIGYGNYYVQSDKYSSIINDAGDTRFEFEEELSHFEECGYGWVYSYIGKKPKLLYVEDTGEIIEVKLDIEYYKHITKSICAITTRGEYNYAIYGEKYKALTPNIYEQTYLNTESLNNTLINVRLGIHRGDVGSNKPNNYNTTAKFDRYGRNCDYLYIGAIGAQEAYTALAVEDILDYNAGYFKGHYFRYKLGKYGDVLSNRTFTSITCSNRSLDRGLVEVWEETNQLTYKGIMDIGGNLLVPPNKYGNIEETPFKDIFIVYEALKQTYDNTERLVRIGIYQLWNGEVISCGTFNKVRLTKLNIIELTHTELNKQMYLGNDRNIYLKLEEAFEMHQLILGGQRQNIYKINVYGVEYLVDMQLDIIKHSFNSENKSQVSWLKL